ncbi:MAG TPA: cytochrome C, partial [Steroidobacteraceae bacterium]|nr:cytochrome C [Steroidobacteraceae bacterium]
MRIKMHFSGKITAAVATLIAALCANAAQALPSFARQTGKPCAQCHTVAYGPALTSYGRQFKLNGYVWGDVTP